MTVVVKLNSRQGVSTEKWVVKDGTGRGAGGRIVSTHRTKRQAKSAARRAARRGERIIVQDSRTGQFKTMRGGR